MADASALSIQVWEPADDPGCFLDLMRIALGERPAARTPEFWRWKHVENPFGTSVGLYTRAERSSEVIGLRMLLRWAFDDGRIRAARAVDTATHPAHQRQGVFSALTREALDRLTAEGVHVVFNTPNPVSLAGYCRLGWRTVTHWPRYIRLLRPLSYWRHRFGIPGGARREGPPLAACFGSEVEPWDRFVATAADRLASLVERSEASRSRRAYRTPRTWPYLAWRYGGLADLHRSRSAGEPYVRYGVFPLEGAGGLRAAAILRPHVSAGLAGVSLVELFLEGPDVELGRAVLSEVHASLTSDYVLAHFARGTVEHSALVASGFHRLPRRSIAFAVRPLAAQGPDPLVADHWDLSLGDLEVF